MCLAVPVKIKSIQKEKAMVELNGLMTEVDISLIPEVKVDQFVIIHVGYALSILDEAEAQEILNYHALS